MVLGGRPPGRVGRRQISQLKDPRESGGLSHLRVEFDKQLRMLNTVAHLLP